MMRALCTRLARKGPIVIDFKCTNCGADLEAEVTAGGRKAKCYKCETEVIVPLPDFLPRTACPNCEYELNLTVDQSGMIVKGPKCGTAVRAPNAEGQSSGCGPLGLVCIAGFIGAVIYLAGWALGT